MALALESDAFRALAYAYRRRLTDGSDAARARCAEAERDVMALGLCVFTPSAVERISEPERLGDILARTMPAPVSGAAPLDDGFVWDDPDDEPSAIANVIGHTLGRAGR